MVALDRNDQPVTDLRREDFTVKEDGRAVELKTFSSVTALGSSQPDDGRVVVLLMDDIGVPVTGTSPMQQIAPVVLSPIGDGDEVSVVRLASRTDEAFGDIRTARDRIDGYRGGAVPFSMRDTPETVLKAIAKIARQLESIDQRRKVILCLGLPAVCDVGEPRLGGTSLIWPAWVAAISAAARANVSVYCVDPTGARGGLQRVERRSRAADRREGLRARERFLARGQGDLARSRPLLSARVLAGDVEARSARDRRERRAQRRPRARAPAAVTISRNRGDRGAAEQRFALRSQRSRRCLLTW